MRIYVVACKNAGAWAYIITNAFYWIYKRLMKNRSVRSCTTMQRSYTKSLSSAEQRIIEKTDTNYLKLAIVSVNFLHWPKPSQSHYR